MYRIPGFHIRHNQDGAEFASSKMRIWAESQQLLEVEHITARALSRLIGKMNAMTL